VYRRRWSSSHAFVDAQPASAMVQARVDAALGNTVGLKLQLRSWAARAPTPRPRIRCVAAYRRSGTEVVAKQEGWV